MPLGDASRGERCVSSREFEQKEHRKLGSLSIGSAHAFERLALPHEDMADAVGLATELDEPPMVDVTVDYGGGHLVVPERRPPPAELQVRGDYHRLPLVGVDEDLEQQPRPARCRPASLSSRTSLRAAEHGPA